MTLSFISSAPTASFIFNKLRAKWTKFVTLPSPTGPIYCDFYLINYRSQRIPSSLTVVGVWLIPCNNVLLRWLFLCPWDEQSEKKRHYVKPRKTLIARGHKKGCRCCIKRIQTTVTVDRVSGECLKKAFSTYKKVL